MSCGCRRKMLCLVWISLLIERTTLMTLAFAPQPHRRTLKGGRPPFVTLRQRFLLHASKNNNGNDNDDKVMFDIFPKEDEKKTKLPKSSSTKSDDDDDLPLWVRAINAVPIWETSTLAAGTDSRANSTGGGWFLMDPILRSFVNVQALLSGGNETTEEIAGLTAKASRNFLDLLTDDDTKPDIESILDSLEGAALIVNVSATPSAGSNNNTSDQFWDDGWNRWDRWIMSMQQALSTNRSSSTVASTASASASTSSIDLTAAAEGILRQATNRLERFLPDVPPAAINSLQAIMEMTNATTALALAAAGSVVSNEAALERAQQLENFAGQLKGVAEGLLRQGYVSSNETTATSDVASTATKQATATTTATTAANRTYRVAKSRQGGALFENFASASELDRYTPILGQAAEMAAMSGVIYEQTVPRARQLGHSIVARGCSRNVKWMVSDSLASHSALELYKDRIDNDPSESPLLIRTITIRGFDAGDEEVDREVLVTQVCTANPEPLGKQYSKIKVHAGLWDIAKAIYQDVKQYIDWTTPQHKIVLNGHSIGGSLANLVLFLLTMERGAEFVQDRVLRVFTFGSPPVAAVSSNGTPRQSKSSSLLSCDVLKAMGLPSDLVWAFLQPWDPICRLFSDIDSLYPLIGDMGPDSDGITPWPKGPPRTLRPVTKAILEAWEGWPRFRDTYYATGSQNYVSVGIQHILLPNPTRYLTDRFLTVSIAVPPVRSVLRISSKEVYPALVTAFPLDVFEISYVPQAIRGFVHHFYPAYGFPLVEYVRLLEERAEPLLVRDNLASAWSSTQDIAPQGGKTKDKNGSEEEEESNFWDSLANPWLSPAQPRRETNETSVATTSR